MSKPQLIVFAGCNGSGKSSFSQSLISDTIIPFDFDKEKHQKLSSFKFDFELKEEMAYQSTLDRFEQLAQEAIAQKTDFAYETNFNHNPLKWPNTFKQAGFEINLVYFTLSDTDKARERVAIRVQNGGHYVSSAEIQRRFEQGYHHLDNYFAAFDRVQIFDTTTDGQTPKQICLIANEKIDTYAALPTYFPTLIPKLTAAIIASMIE